MHDAIDHAVRLSEQEADDALIRGLSQFDHFRRQQSARSLDKFLSRTQEIYSLFQSDTPRASHLTLLLQAMDQASDEVNDGA